MAILPIVYLLLAKQKAGRIYDIFEKFRLGVAKFTLIDNETVEQLDYHELLYENGKFQVGSEFSLV